MELRQEIKQYYFKNIDKLPNDKQFHFATRIAAWDGDPQAFELLRKLKDYIVPDVSDKGLHTLLAAIIAETPTDRYVARSLRQPYFEKYPKLYGLHLALFRVRHLESVYGIDARNPFFVCVSQTELDELTSRLLADDETTRILSTYAVNFLYLYKGVVLRQMDQLDPKHFINVSHGYDPQDKTQLKLMIYLLTHCIIGESNFYTEKISAERLGTYRQMLEILESLINSNFAEISLDNKLEFLVCCRICAVDSKLAATIHDECLSSISTDGHFLIDRHNSNARASQSSLARSEHRNVLFIMSSSAYGPHSRLAD